MMSPSQVGDRGEIGKVRMRMWKVRRWGAGNMGTSSIQQSGKVFRFQNTAIWNEGSIFGCLQIGDSLIIEQ